MGNWGNIYISQLYYPNGIMKQLGISRIDERNRTRIPLKVLEFLPKGDRLSWELNDNGIVCVFIGHERFLRNKGGGDALNKQGISKS